MTDLSADDLTVLLLGHARRGPASQAILAPGRQPMTFGELGQRIFDNFLRVASGEKTKSELLGLGRHEFAPWQIGILG